MGLAIKRLIWIFRGLLSIITSFLVLKLKYPELHLCLWNIHEYNIIHYEEIVNSEYILWGIGLSLINFVFFYLVLQLLTEKTIGKVAEQKLKNLYESLSKHQMRVFKYCLWKVARKSFSFLYRYKLYRPTQNRGVEEITFNEFSKITYNMFFTTLHILICTVILWRFNLILAISLFIIALVFMVILISTHSYLQVITIMKDIIRHEHNRNIK